MSDADEAYLRILRSMTWEQKFRALNDLYWTARELKATGFRIQHPEWSEEEVQEAVRKVMLYGRT